MMKGPIYISEEIISTRKEMASSAWEVTADDQFTHARSSKL